MGEKTASRAAACRVLGFALKEMNGAYEEDHEALEEDMIEAAKIEFGSKEEIEEDNEEEEEPNSYYHHSKDS